MEPEIIRRKNKAKKCQRLCAALLFSTALFLETPVSACAADTEPVTLHYWICDHGEYYTRKIVDAYQMIHPDVQIELHIIENAQYDDEVKAVIQSGEQADLCWIRGVTKITDYQSEGLLLELNDELAKSDLDTTAYGNMFTTYTIDDRYYGLPERCTCWVLYYNKTLFDEAGIPYPDQMTWEEYAELALQLTNAEEGDEKIWGGYFANWCYQFAGVQRRNYLYDDDISETLEGLQLLNRFYNGDQSHVPLKDVMEIGDDYVSFFEAGRVAMMPQGEWVAGMLMEDAQEGKQTVDWDIAPMPVFEGQEAGTTWGQYQFAGITSCCSHPEEAFEFLSWLCGEGGAQIIAGSGIISGYMTTEIQEIYRNSLRGRNVDVFFQSQRNLENPPRIEYNELLASFTNVSEQYLLQEISWEDAVSEIEAERQRIYGDG